MKQSNRVLMLGVTLLALNFAGTAHGQYVDTGTTIQSGSVVVGSGPSLGSLSSGDGILSATGFDKLTFNAGSFAIGSGTSTITFNTQGNTVINLGVVNADVSQDAFDFFSSGSQTITNSGTIQGGVGTDLNVAGYGINFFAPSFTDVTITNHGLIAGGTGFSSTNGGYENGTSGDYGISLYASSEDIANITITNTGSILGGAGGSGDAVDGYTSGNGTPAISIVSEFGVLNGITITNSGLLQGGDSGAAGFESSAAGNAVSLFADSNISNITITNTGSILGGNSGLVSGDYSYESGNGGSGIWITSIDSISNVTVTNSGLILGGTTGDVNGQDYEGEYSGTGGYGISMSADVNLTNVTLSNSGTITGGNGGSLTGDEAYDTYPGGDAIRLMGNDDISAVTINNSGLIKGGNSGDTTGLYAFYSYQGGDGIHLESDDGTVENITIHNTGLIQGGNSGSVTYIPAGGGYELFSGTGGNAVFLDAADNISNISITNSGTMLGGNSGDVIGYYANESYDAGNGIYLYSGTENISTVSITNTGLIQGGISGSGSGNGDEYIETQYGGEGVYIYAFNNISNISLVNSGTIAGGAGGNAYGYNAYYGAGGGYGVEFISTQGSLSNTSIVNSGLIAGGNTGNYVTTVGGYNEFPGEGGVGIDIDGATGINNATIINSGRILGGSGGNISGGSVNDLYGGYGDDGVYVASGSGPITNVTILNTGTIAAGNGGNASGGAFTDIGGAGGYGVEISGSSGAGNANITVTNYGVIAGGNGGTSDQVGESGTAGYGITSIADGVTINNWGNIAAGSVGIPLPAIYLSGSNNTVNLNGHSSVYGAISGIGSNMNNVLNLNFTGLSPAAQAALVAQITAQGNLNNFTGTFTVRGVTYTVDPMVIHLNLSSYQVQALTPNQGAIGANLDSFPTNPAPGSGLFNLLNAIDASGNVPGALDALSPTKYAIYGELAIQNTTGWVQNVDRRLNNLRDGSESVDTTGLGGDNTVALTSDYSKDGDTSKDSKQVVQPAPTENRWGFFATGNGLFFRGSSRDTDTQNGKSNTAGTLVGIDGKAGEHAVIGAFGAYDNSAVELGTDGSHATIQSYTGGLYGSYHQDGLYLNTLAAYTRNNYSSDRNIVLPGFAVDDGASTHSNQYSANIDGGYDWNLTNRLSAGPTAGLQYVHLDVNGFGESGAAGALGIGAQSVNSLQSRVGGHLDFHLLTQPNDTAAVELYAAWQHEYLDNSRAIDAEFEGSGAGLFSVQTGSPRRDAGVVGASVNFTFKNRLTLFGDYELQMWSASQYEQTVNGGARISF